MFRRPLEHAQYDCRNPHNATNYCDTAFFGNKIAQKRSFVIEPY